MTANLKNVTNTRHTSCRNMERITSSLKQNVRRDVIQVNNRILVDGYLRNICFIFYSNSEAFVSELEEEIERKYFLCKYGN